jgi:NADH:ubiquinone oxidoreductase subunit F (NADH-binding)
VLEGALIAAHVLAAGEIVVGVKRSAASVLARLEAAIAEVRAAGWLGDVDLRLVAGPDEYLFGEETALLEVIDGRPPFPRIAPPYRRGVEEVVETAGDVAAHSSSAAHVELAGVDHIAPPTLASNVETFANLPGILAHGAAWFRSVGTDDSPGTIVCTVIGDTVRHGVAEVALGTPLATVIDAIGGGMPEGRTVAAVMSGVANPLLPGDALDTPLTYEAMRAAGSGLGCAGFIVLDDRTDFVAVAAGVARFLAVESCGQCAACKGDGLKIAEELARLAGSEAGAADLGVLDDRLASVADGARCNLPYQTQAVVGSIFELFPEEVGEHREHRGEAAGPVLVAEILRLDGDRAVLDERQADKQPDWTYDQVPSGQWPADRLDDHRSHEGV